MNAKTDTGDRAIWHPWLRIQRLVRSILAVRRDEATRPVLKATLTNAIRERERFGGPVGSVDKRTLSAGLGHNSREISSDRRGVALRKR